MKLTKKYKIAPAIDKGVLSNFTFPKTTTIVDDHEVYLESELESEEDSKDPIELSRLRVIKNGLKLKRDGCVPSDVPSREDVLNMGIAADKFIYVLSFLLRRQYILSPCDELPEFEPETDEEKEQWLGPRTHNRSTMIGARIGSKSKITITSSDIEKNLEKIAPISYYVDAVRSKAVTSEFRDYYRVLEYYWGRIATRSNERDRETSQEINRRLGEERVSPETMQSWRGLRNKCSHTQASISNLDIIQELEPEMSVIRDVAMKLIKSDK